MNLLNLLIAIFATYRLARLIAIDEGPAIDNKIGLFLKLRTKLGAYDLRPDGQAKSNLGRGISCVHCVGVYLALPMAILVSGIGWYTLVYWLAIAGGSSFLWSVHNET